MGTCNYGAVSSECPEMQGFRPSFREIDDMQDQSDSAARENEWADLSEPTLRARYSEPQLRRFKEYQGQLESIPEERCRALLKELLEYFEVDGLYGMPLPPTGLPGKLHDRFDPGDEEARLLEIGYEYFLCTARSQSRAMHNRWDAAATFIRRIEDRVRKALSEEMAASWQRQSVERSSKPQLVYFIASESGPIKIGMARHPQARCKELQTSHHEKLTVLATCKGGQAQEHAYHVQFAAFRRHGEWFNRAPEILAEIDRLNGGEK